VSRGGERGAASILALGLVAVSCLLGIVVADIGIYLRGRAAAATAADAAALAAAPVTFSDFGAAGSPAAEAGRFAAANGASLVACDCPIDRTWRPRTVRVVVAVPVHLVMFGVRDVPASSRAEFDPTALVDPQRP
jgi:secretion/DNA translocation related TadE-like protein